MNILTTRSNDQIEVFIYRNGVPLYKKGEETEKQPVWVGDVAAGVIAAMKDSESIGRTYQFVG